MNKLYNKLKDFDINKAIEFEEKDRQYIALKNLWDNLEEKNSSIYLSFIIVNSIICYQLSGKGEDYWEEFSIELLKYLNSGKYKILPFFLSFLPNSKNNKRFVNIKIKRVEKTFPFLKVLENREEYYYNNMDTLVFDLAYAMNQKNTAKTIVFAVKMFGYGARNCFKKLIYFPENISIPIDSRLIKIFNKYSEGNEKIDVFYKLLSEKLEIPELHLDAVIWNNKELI